MDEDELRYAIATDFTAYVVSAQAGYKFCARPGRHRPDRIR